MQDLKTAVKELREASDEAIDNGQPVQIPAAIAPGDMLPQGDVGLLMLSEIPHAATRLPCPDGGQLAPGTSKGSRHCIPQEFWKSLTFYRISDGDELSDIVIEASKPFDLVHPEHADHLGYPAGVYRVRHQQNEQRQRVID